jgi:hypothetical protein
MSDNAFHERVSQLTTYLNRVLRWTLDDTLDEYAKECNSRGITPRARSSLHDALTANHPLPEPHQRVIADVFATALHSSEAQIWSYLTSGDSAACPAAKRIASSSHFAFQAKGLAQLNLEFARRLAGVREIVVIAWEFPLFFLPRDKMRTHPAFARLSPFQKRLSRESFNQLARTLAGTRNIRSSMALLMHPKTVARLSPEIVDSSVDELDSKLAEYNAIRLDTGQVTIEPVYDALPSRWALVLDRSHTFRQASCSLHWEVNDSPLGLQSLLQHVMPPNGFRKT